MGILEPAGLVLDMKNLNLVLAFVLELAKILEPCTHLYLGKGIDLDPCSLFLFPSGFRVFLLSWTYNFQLFELSNFPLNFPGVALSICLHLLLPLSLPLIFVVFLIATLFHNPHMSKNYVGCGRKKGSSS